MTPASVGFVGLGIMGTPMARNLLAAGYPLIVHSRSPGSVAELVSAGAEAAGSPAEVAARASTVITMLPDGPDVEAVLAGDAGILASAVPGSLIIDMSTIAPAVARRLAASAGQRGVAMLDAPVSGGERGAIDGALSIMVGGSAQDLARALPVLEVLGRSIVHVGDAGAGQVAKACNQLVVAVTIEAVGEALALAARAGVDPTAVREALLGGFAGSKVLEVHGQRMLDGAFGPGFRVALHAKDARIVRDTVDEVGAVAPAFAATDRQLSELVAGGFGDLDHAALYLLLRPLRRVDVADAAG